MLGSEMVDPPFIGDWYREKKLGSGSFGLVTLWKNKKSGDSVAIKKCHILKESNTSNEKFRERWENEVNLMCNTIKCDNIVKTIRVKPASFLETLMKTNYSGLPLLIMEYCEGGDLRTMLNKRSNCCGLKEAEVRSLLKSLKNAVAYLHDRGITHRDIKPENIVVKKHDGDTNVYKLTDLGYARALDIKSLNASIVGTVEYLAPELIQDAKYNNSVDYWSLGVIAFEIACGIRPFIPHAPLVQWMLALKKKVSKHISITEENASEPSPRYTYHETMFNETRLSSYFKESLEKWLTLALEMNPKQRGFVFEIPKPDVIADATVQGGGRTKSVTFAGNDMMKPVQKLKIFSLLDEIMEQKVLTVFSLYSCELLSFPIDNKTTMLQLYQMIAQKMQISVDEIDFVMPLDQQIDKITDSTIPIQLYLENSFDKPMVYVIRKPCDKKFMTILKDEVQPTIPRTIAMLLAKSDETIKPHILKHFLVNCYYFIQNEMDRYETMVDGLQNYVLGLNHEITVYKQTISEMNQLIQLSRGCSEMYNNSLNHIRESLDDSMAIVNFMEVYNQWLDQYNKINMNIGKLNDAITKVNGRFDSVLRRSNVLLHDGIMNDKDAMAIYNMVELENLYQDLLIQIIDKQTNDKSHKKLLKFIYTSLRKRDAMLRDDKFIKLQRELSMISIEHNEIRKTVVNVLPQAERYKNEIIKMNSDLLTNYSKLLISNLSTTSELQGPKANSNLERDAGKPVAATAAANDSGGRGIDFQIGAAISSMNTGNIKPEEFLCFGEGPDLLSLLDDSQSIINSLDDLIDDGIKSFRGATISHMQF